MKDGKRRLKQRCENDLKHVHDAIQKVCVLLVLKVAEPVRLG